MLWLAGFCKAVSKPYNQSVYAPVAQLDRVFGYEPKGRGFESRPAYHQKKQAFLSLLFCFI